MPVLADVFDPRRNSLNALRLLLAVAVIVSHSWPLTGAGEDPGVLGSTLGSWSVTAFFVISGYLITASRFASANLAGFLWKRFLRIYPAFFASLLLVAAVLAPLAAVLRADERWSARGSMHFVLSNASLFINTWTIDGTLADLPRDAWNGSLWTLVYEAGCYVLVGLLVTIVRTRRNTLIAMAVLFSAGVALGVRQVVEVGGAQQTAGLGAVVQLVPAFLAGGLLYLCRTHVPLGAPAVLMSAVIVVVAIVGGVFPVVAPLPLGIVLFWLAARLPLRRIAARADPSYGVYVYAFPVQQMLVVLGAAVLPVSLFAAIAIAVVVPVAYASWHIIESPALRFKGLFDGPRPARSSAQITEQRAGAPVEV